jgi:hypothetical protein
MVALCYLQSGDPVMADSAAGKHPKVHLIESDEPEPALKVKLGMRFEVRATTIVDTEMKPAKKVAARLCGGTTTCLALVEL